VTFPAGAARRSQPDARVQRAAKLALICALLGAAGCAPPPGPSVPQQPGRSLADARAALQTCAGEGPRGGRAALTANYIGSVIWGGVVLGPLLIAANQENIQANGEVNAVDRCLSRQGFERRELTTAEVRALKQRDRYAREQLLDHLIRGGTLEGYSGA